MISGSVEDSTWHSKVAQQRPSLVRWYVSTIGELCGKPARASGGEDGPPELLEKPRQALEPDSYRAALLENGIELRHNAALLVGRRDAELPPRQSLGAD